MSKDDTPKFKSKSHLKSEFNMGAYYLEFLCKDIMTQVAFKSLLARRTQKFRAIDDYYNIVYELWSHSETVWNANETKIVENMLKKIRLRFDLQRRELIGVDAEFLINKIGIVQRCIYNLIRRYNMLVPLSASERTKEEKIQMLEDAFGLTHENTDEDDKEESKK